MAESSREPSVARETGSERGRVIAVYGTRNDVGVSTIASALASAFLTAGEGRVALAELDARSVRARAEAERAVPAAPLAESNGADRATVERVMVPGTDGGLARRSDGLWMFAPSRRRTPSLNDAKAVSLALDAMRAGFAVSVAELEHQVNERTLAAFDAADRIVMVTEGSVPSLRGSQRVLRLCRRLNYPDEKMCVVVNRHDSPGTIPVADIATILKREVYWRVAAGQPVDATELAAKLAS